MNALRRWLHPDEIAIGAGTGVAVMAVALAIRMAAGPVVNATLLGGIAVALLARGVGAQGSGLLVVALAMEPFAFGPFLAPLPALAAGLVAAGGDAPATFAERALWTGRFAAGYCVAATLQRLVGFGGVDIVPRAALSSFVIALAFGAGDLWLRRLPRRGRRGRAARVASA